MARKRRKPGNRRLWIVLVGAVLAAVIMAVAIRPGLLDRVLHPGRYAVSGEARLPVGRYAEAGAAVLGGRVARLILPAEGGPVIVTGARTAFLDPPTAHVLGVTDAVSSPTFSIINQYLTGNGDNLYHIDLYRLKDEAEALNAGVEDCLFSGNTCLVEWPAKAPGIFPEDTLHIYLVSTGSNTRKLRI